MKRPTTLRILCLLAVLGVPLGAQAYQLYGVRVGGRNILLKWNQVPVRYFIRNAGASGVSAAQLQAAVDRAFNTWEDVPSAEVSGQFQSFTSAQPFEDDGAVVIGFLNEPDQEDVLGATNFLIDDRTGEIVESDIYFNSSFPWSVASSGETGRFDLEAIAVHEIGHLWGLGHSAVGETEQVSGGRRVLASGAAMFPIAFSPGNVKLRTLQADDIAGVSELYPSGSFERETGSVTGTVTKNGRGVFGAHVVAFNPQTGAIVGNLTEEDGRFTISGLEPGLVIVRVEPLDDADLDSFFDDTEEVDVDFRVTFFNRYAVVPAGGSSTRLEIKVTPK